MTSSATENRVCTVQVCHFTHFCHARKKRYSSGPPGARGPRFVEPPEPPVSTPLHGTQANIPTNLILSETEKLESLAYIFAANSAGYHSNFCDGLQASENACILKQSTQWPFKVIHGR